MEFVLTIIAARRISFFIREIVRPFVEKYNDYDYRLLEAGGIETPISQRVINSASKNRTNISTNL